VEMLKERIGEKIGIMMIPRLVYHGRALTESFKLYGYNLDHGVVHIILSL